MPEPSPHGGVAPREGALIARPEDLTRLRELFAEARSSVLELRGGRLLLEEPRSRRSIVEPGELQLGGERALLLGGWYEDVLVGVAAAVLCGGELDDASSLATVTLLYVEPAARGVGVGESLLAAVVAWCAERGCPGLDVAALPGDRSTKSLLERFGFTARKVVMHRSLDPSSALSAARPHERA